MSGVTVPTTIKSTSCRSNGCLSSRFFTAQTARSLAATPFSTICRSRIPTRSRIHSFVVSTIFSRSALVRTRGGKYVPSAVIFARRDVVNEGSCIKETLYFEGLKRECLTGIRATSRSQLAVVNMTPSKASNGWLLPSNLSRGPLPFLFHPISNEVRTRNDPEASTFAIHQVKQRVAVHFFEVRKAQQGPQLTLHRRLHELIQRFQMSSEKFPGHPDRDMRGNLGRILLMTHVSPRANGVLVEPYIHLMPGKTILAKRVVNGV